MIRSIPNVQVKIDEADSSTVYFGYANPQSATSDRDWEICRQKTVGNITTESWAEDDDIFPHIWDNRASLTYE